MSTFNKIIGRREIHDLRNFVESFNSEDGAALINSKVNEENGIVIEELKNQVNLKVSLRI